MCIVVEEINGEVWRNPSGERGNKTSILALRALHEHHGRLEKIQTWRTKTDNHAFLNNVYFGLDNFLLYNLDNGSVVGKPGKKGKIKWERKCEQYSSYLPL